MNWLARLIAVEFYENPQFGENVEFVFDVLKLHCAST